MGADEVVLVGPVYKTAPPLHQAWLAFEEKSGGGQPARKFASALERQPVYAEECRTLHARMMAPGGRYHSLSEGIVKREFFIPSSNDEHRIPIVQLDSEEGVSSQPELVLIYYHGGGLRVGEADSEELSCRFLVKFGGHRVRLYSIGYRLLPLYAAEQCLSDAMDGFTAFRSDTAKSIIVGSSSGGQLASAVAQAAPDGSVDGVLLRCPVTADRASGPEYVPESLLAYHTSVSPSFVNSALGYLERDVPRDGLSRLPLEASTDELKNHPRTWIQLCSNDTLYSDGLCYAILLRRAGVDVKVAVETGWPHTFWLKAPELEQSFEAENRMVSGLEWVLAAGP